MLREDVLFNIGLPGDTSTNVISFINRHLQTRYQDLMAEFKNWQIQQPQTASTVASQQYYHYPPGVVAVETATITQGTIVYPLEIVNSQQQWNYINQYPNTNTFIPQFIFPRQYDFGVWPIPTDAYTITFNFIYRDRNLNVEDYTTGTVDVTNNSQTVESTGAVFTSAMIGRFFVLTDASGYPTDYWYPITGVDEADDELTLQTFYEGTTASTQNYLIGQVPLLPDEAHILLSWGVTADWYGTNSDTDKAKQFNNMYYTGDPQNNNREARNVSGGLIGLRERYAERADRRVVTFNSKNRINFYPNYINTILPSA